MVSKRKRNHIEKAMRNSKGASQILLQEQKPTFYEDEFTIHKPIEKILMNLVIEARKLEVNKKQMVNSTAWQIENELKRMNRPELICHISDVMLSALRRNKVNWSIAYLRKVLPEKYKDPAKRNAALTRFQRAGPPGTPPDTGLTAEELEPLLNRKSTIGKYTVHCDLELGDNTGLWVECVAADSVDETGEILNCPYLPVVVHVDATAEPPTATVELDEDAHDEILKRMFSSKSKPKRRTKQ